MNILFYIKWIGFTYKFESLFSLNPFKPGINEVGLPIVT